MGQIEYQRKTKETDIWLSINIRGQGDIQIKTGLGYADHMLTLLAFWAGFDLQLKACGDLEVDAHHTLEDIGLCLGEVVLRSLKDKSGIGRVGWVRIPMDEALTEVVLDISGRPFLVYEDMVVPSIVFGQEKDVWREFFKSFVFRAGMNCHIHCLYGRNGHHLLESVFKGLGLALSQALSPQERGIFSTKGSLD